ncbi:MAG TPA: arginyltransferase [Spirochaetota bacterium]|jgi:arginine-tRNA-protein transferase|nr:arginyltransferase [Spirochaetota bacterium]OPZ36130.1 MAG: arginyl-tRNA-protein transferase [Spirochaetes bacterium ADurb.BinA120]HNU92632.1 arginyltransferase [Spirochaetota bacterium]HPI14810.1 arginyltransferase [Spirochaetota bacterium]HPO46612.1 arginyltransferase [Spirochaetota bacterium]
MLTFQEPRLSDEAPCPYLSGRRARFEYFFAAGLDAGELDGLISAGWRKFGIYYFRPSCPGCESCVPLRVPVAGFRPSKGQRRVIRKNIRTEARFGPLSYRPEVYSIYREHSLARFGRGEDLEDFLSNFYRESCPALQSEYYEGGRLMAVGFLDRSSGGLSSVYFVFRTEFARNSPGIYSVIREIELAASLGLPYYYLGYCVEGCPRMEYKAEFRPFERYSWRESRWLGPEG